MLLPQMTVGDSGSGVIQVEIDANADGLTTAEDQSQDGDEPLEIHGEGFVFGERTGA